MEANKQGYRKCRIIFGKKRGNCEDMDRSEAGRNLQGTICDPPSLLQIRTNSVVMVATIEKKVQVRSKDGVGNGPIALLGRYCIPVMVACHHEKSTKRAN